MSDLVELSEIVAAHERIAAHVLWSPLIPLSSAGVLLKAENLQRTGAFKIRGALNTILQLHDAARGAGVIAHSSGNHAMAVACAGALLGVPATVVMPSDAPEVKIAGTRAFGGEVVLVGPGSDERIAMARSIAAERGLTMVEPYDSRTIVAATGTIALEVLQDAPGVREIYVPISGGGLAAGVARAAKLLDPSVWIVGVEPELAADALASRRAGHQVALPAADMARTSADGLRVQRVGDVPWPHIVAHVDEIVTVSEDEIADAIRLVTREARLVVEPSGAVPVAAAVAGRGGCGAASSQRVAIVSGGNLDPSQYAAILASAPRSG